MGVGKSTVGRVLAGKLGLPFIDLDDRVESETGRTIHQIFDEDGEEKFREIEQRVLQVVLGGPPAVVALGGGTLHHSECRALLEDKAQVVVLWLPFQQLRERLGDSNDVRPLWSLSEALFGEREQGYLMSGAVVNVDGCSVVEVADRVERAVDCASHRTIMNVSSLNYPVVLGDSLQGLGSSIRSVFPLVRRVIVIADAFVGTHYAESIWRTMDESAIQFEQIDVPAGEGCKTVQVWEDTVERVLELGVDRTTPIVALGGGSLGDLAGFVAATVMRGVPLVQVPTTLLAMVDSSVGGKTGLNTKHGKNLVGSFYQPSLVFAPLTTLFTLSDQEYLSGLGEVIKHGVLGDSALFEICRERANEIRMPDTLRELVKRSVELKAAIVAQDERESGLRAILNLGHTVGHAIEKVSIDHGAPIPHGVCVAMGVYAEVRWAEEVGECEAGTADSVGDVMQGLGLPLRPENVDIDALIQSVKFDKKLRRGTLATAVVEAVGRVRLAEVKEADIRTMFSSLEDV